MPPQLAAPRPPWSPVIALVAALFINEVPLRTTVARQPEDATPAISESVDTVR